MGLPAKTTRPSSRRLAPRRRLFRLLDRDPRCPVVWVAGPAGSGKTSLLSSYLAARRSPTLWYQVDAGDSDPATFFCYMGAALEHSARRRGQALPLLTTEYLHDVPTFARRFFEELIARLGTAPTIVLDNYQDLPGDAALHKILSRGFAAVPEGARIIVASRRLPPPAFARLRTHGQLRVIGWDDLRLTLPEALNVARARGDRELRRADVQAAHATADGWAAGLVMLLTSPDGAAAGRRAATGRLSREQIFDYFGSELFDEIDPETQRFLLQTALLPRMTARMARDLTGLKHAGEILARLSDSHFFTTRDLQREPVFEYHPLFRAFLLARGRHHQAPAATTPPLERAAVILEDQGRVDEALALLAEGAAWERLAETIVRHAPTIMAQGRHRTIESWIAALPADVVATNAWLLFWRGVALMPTDLTECRTHLEAAFARFDAQGEATGRLLAWSAIVDSHLYSWDDFSPLDRWIAWLDEQAPAVDSAPAPAQAAVVTSMVGALVHRQPHHPRIAAWIERAWRLMAGDANVQDRLRAANYAFLHHFWMGDTGKAAAIADVIQRIAQAPNAPPLSRVAWKWCEAAAAIWRDAHSPGQGLRAVEEGLAVARESGVHTLDYMLLAQGAIASIATGDLASARASLEDMAGFAQGRNARAYHHYLTAWHAALSGEWRTAAAHAEQALRLAIESGMPYSEALARLAQAELLQQQGRVEEAAQQVAEARRLTEPTGSAFFSCAAHLAEARLFLTTGCCGSPDALRSAMETMRRQHMVNTYFWIPEWMAALCLSALDQGIETAYVRGLIRKRRLAPELPPLRCAQWPWEIRIMSLGALEVQRDDEPLEFSGKAPRKTLLFLKTLIACGGRGVGSERMADLLWPDAEGDCARRALETCLYRLRQLLRNERVIQLREGWIRLDGRHCWVDAHAFDALLTHADEQRVAAGEHESLSVEQRGEMEQALALYRGPFLSEAAEPWLVPYRERLRQRFLLAVERVGESYERERRFDRAEQCYQKALEAEETAEGLFRLLIRCYASSGRAAEALTTYERCRRVLRSALGVDPSQETERLLARLLQPPRDAGTPTASVH